MKEVKIKIQKSVAFLYPNSELLKKDIRETIQFIVTSKRITARHMSASMFIAALFTKAKTWK